MRYNIPNRAASSWVPGLFAVQKVQKKNPTPQISHSDNQIYLLIIILYLKIKIEHFITERNLKQRNYLSAISLLLLSPNHYFRSLIAYEEESSSDYNILLMIFDRLY